MDLECVHKNSRRIYKNIEYRFHLYQRDAVFARIVIEFKDTR